MNKCPYYKNKDVFDGFNKMVKAFGGKPLTEEEFRDPELRNQRQGPDYNAMECAYRTYDRNGGNFLDKTPDGKPSILYQTLLDYFGNEEDAINAKANVYSDEFFNWFGDWINDPNNASKVVDANAEPLVVWHSLNKREFEDRLANWFSTKRQQYYGDFEFPVYLNIKNIYKNDNPSVQERALVTEYNSGNEYDKLSDLYDGAMVWHNVFGYYEIVTTRNSSQIKHIENLGTWNPNNPNIYKLVIGENEAKSLDAEEDLLAVHTSLSLENASLSSIFGQSLMQDLLSGKTINSKDVLYNLLLSNIFTGPNINLANVLSIHDIPVRLDYTLEPYAIAETITDDTTQGAVILINPITVQIVSNRYAGIAILHEMVHAVTVNALNNPLTKELKEFARVNNKVFSKITKLYLKNPSILSDYDSGLYGLTNEKEFAAVFITDPTARDNYIRLAKLADKNRGNFLNLIRDFINSIVHLFVNKNLFVSNEDLLNSYEQLFRDYLNGVPQVSKDSIPSNSKLKTIYKSLDYNTYDNERLIEENIALLKYQESLEKSPLKFLNWDIPWKRTQQDKASAPEYQDIINALKIRVDALRTSDIDVKTRTSLIDSTQTQIAMFENMNLPKYTAITATLKTIIPLLLLDIEYLRKCEIDGKLSGKDYMYNMHSSFGMYYNISNTLEKILEEDINIKELISEYNNTVLEEDKHITEEDVEDLIHDIKNVTSSSKTGINILEILLKLVVAGKHGILREVGEGVESLEMLELLKNVNSDNPVLPQDIKSIWMYVGSMDSSESPSLRALSKMVKDAMDKADDEALDRGINLMKVAKRLKRGESVKDVYEHDENGQTTGYVVRDLNWGKFYKDYDNFVKELNKTLNLPEDNRVAPNDEETRIKWNEARNKFLDEHCERKYTSEYYKLWNSIPLSVKESIDSYNILINAILEPVRDKVTKIPKYDDLSDEDWKKLNALYTEKNLLRSDYNEFGVLRRPGDPDYETAKALLNLYAHLYPKEAEILKNEDAWNAERNRIIEECGGVDKYLEYILTGKEVEGFDSKRFEKWESRNTRWEFKKDDDGDVIIFLEIKEALKGELVDYGKEYDDLKKEYDDILKPFRDQRGIVNVLLMPDATLNRLGDINAKMNIIKSEVKQKNPRVVQFLKKRAELYEQYFIKKPTDYYESIYSELTLAAIDEDTGIVDNYFLGAMLNKYGNTVFIDESFDGDFVHYSYDFLSKNYAKDRLKYMKPTPGRAWYMHNDNLNYLNPEFLKLILEGSADENSTFIPKRSLYDNSKAFSKFREFNKDGSKNKDYSPTLAALRNETIKMIDDANKKLSNRTYTDKYLLPQITGTLYKRLKRSKHKWHTFMTWVRELIGLKVAENDYSEIGSDLALDVMGDLLEEQIGVSQKEKPVGRYPDGRQFNILPQYYTRKLLDPSTIDYDLVKIVQTYYHMSCGYEQRLKIKDDCESILDFIKRQVYMGSGQYKKGGKYDSESNTYRAAEKFLEMNLYDIKRKQFSIGKWDVSKTASLVKRWTTAKNLGLNPKVAAVGFLTAFYNHIINMITGLRYNGTNGFFAFLDVVKNLGGLVKGVGDPLSDNEIYVLAEWAGIANQRERKFSGTNRNKNVNNVWRNSTYGLLSTVDFLTKTQIMRSVFRNYKYVNNEFISMDDIVMRKYDLGEKGYKELKDAYNKSNKSLVNVLRVKDKKLYCEKEYQNAWNLCKNIVRNRIQKYAEAADGMPTELQRAAITLSWLGAYVLIHRNYLPLMLQERFGDTVYDFDTRQYKNGQFKRMINVAYDIAQSGYIPGITVGFGIGFAFGGPFAAFVGSLVGANIARIAKKKGTRKSVKETWNSAFNDYSSKKAAINSQMNIYFRRQLISEILGYQLIRLFVNFICAKVSEPDKKNNWWIQMIAYWLRAFQWEAYTPYRTTDLLNNIRSVSAATSTLDSVEGITDVAGAIATSIPKHAATVLYNATDPTSSLIDPSYNMVYQSGIFREMLSGAYKNMPEWLKIGILAFPFHNAIEQVKNSKAKRLYIENQFYKGDY